MESSRRTILIVEDDAFVRMMGIDLLEDAGFEVIDAGNADHAMELLEGAAEVKLMFSDIDMPGTMNGLQLAKLVRQRWPDIRLLLTSGHHHVPQSQVPDDGRFVSKPYSSNAIISEITDMLKDG